MADASFTPTDPLYQAASNPMLAQTGNAAWDKAFADYVCFDALQDADHTFGGYAAALEDHTLTKVRLIERFGKAYSATPEAAAEAEAAFEKVSEAERTREAKYLRPYWKSAIALAMTPAPNLAAAIFKVQLVKREQLERDGDMPRDPMEIVNEDMARLAV